MKLYLFFEEQQYYLFFFHIKCIQSTKITSQASNSGHYKISSVLTSCDAFHSFMLRIKLSNFVFSFSKTANCTWQPQWTHAILVHFKKNYLCLFTANCTQNHVITYAYLLKLLAKLALILNTHNICRTSLLTHISPNT